MRKGIRLNKRDILGYLKLFLIYLDANILNYKNTHTEIVHKGGQEIVIIILTNK